MKNIGESFLQSQIKETCIAVIGDIMLDRYITGSVNRISPEAPVPVHLVKSQRMVPGGAANTAANLSSLGCQVFLAGMRGKDDDGQKLEELLNESGIDYSGVMTISDYHTTSKVRILGAGQQMLRLDYEENKIADDSVIKALLSWLKKLLENKIGCIVLSDYGKGMVTPVLAQKVIRLGYLHEVPVLVDPKGTDWTKYRGAYGITPNVKELSDCIGKTIENEDKKIEETGQKIREKYQLKNLFITRSEKGLTCINSEGAVHKASVAQSVFDVSGAGDTVMAVLAAATAKKIEIETTLELANIAAGIAVSKVGTYQVKREELLAAWQDVACMLRQYKPLSWSEAQEKVALWRSRGEKIVFTNGCFDILHRGHVTYLQQAASLGNRLIIGLNSDKSVKRLKGEERPVNGELDRAFILASLRMVDEVVIFDEDTPEKLLSLLKPDILAKGGDYKVEEIAGREFADKVKILPFVKGYSTTKIIGQIKKK